MACCLLNVAITTVGLQQECDVNMVKEGTLLLIIYHLEKCRDVEITGSGQFPNWKCLHCQSPVNELGMGITFEDELNLKWQSANYIIYATSQRSYFIAVLYIYELRHNYD